MTGAQERGWPQPLADDVATIDGVIAAAYAAVSARPGETRDLDRFRSLFRPEARLLSVSRRGGETETALLELEEFAGAFAGVVPAGVFEREVHRSGERFGDIAHVWSTYEIRATPQSAEVQVRGINSLQLVREAGRWWIVSGVFQNESPEAPIPDSYVEEPSAGGGERR